MAARSVNPAPGRRRNRSLKPRDPTGTRGAILAAATHEFAARGLSGARVDVIARRARVNKRMLYHYFDSKDGLYLAVLEATYEGLRGSERALDLTSLAPVEAMRRLIEFNFDYMRAHPELIGILNNENLHRARYLARSRRVRELHSPLVAMIAKILERGAARGDFRDDIDPVHLYVSIAAVGYFYLANRWTLSAIFGRDLDAAAEITRRRAHNVEMILSALRPRAPARRAPGRRRTR